MQKPVEVKIKTDSSAQTTVQKTTAAFKDQEKAIAKVAAAQAKLGQSYGVVSKGQATSLAAMQQYIQSLNGMNGASVKAIGSITNAAGTFQRYAVAVKDSDESVKTFKMSVNTATGEVYQLDTGIKSISSTAQSAGQAFMSLGESVANSVKQIIGLASIGSMIRDALGEMQDMSDELVTYKKVTGATAEEVERVRKEAYASAQKYGQSPSDFLGSVSTFARAGYKEQSATMADLATKTMLVGDMSAEAASSFLITADAGYQLGGSIEALNAIIDKANIIDNNYATSFGKIADGFTIAAPLANTMGMSVDELMASLGTISAVTQRSGTETARALRALMLNIMGDTTTEIEDGVTATEESVGALQKVLQKYAKDALAAAKASGKVLNPLEAIAALNEAWKNNDLSDAELMQIVSGLGGKLRSNELMAIVQNYDMLVDMLEKLKTESGSADDEVSAMMDSWTAKAQNLKTAFVEITNNSIQEGMVKNLLDTATGFVKWTGSLENFVGVAGAGLKAISALNAGVKNLLNGQAFGGANAWTLGITAAIAAISTLKSAIENYYRTQRNIIAESANTITENVEKSQNVVDIVKKYKEIAKDGVIETDELETARSLQAQITSLVGDQATNLDLVNGKIETQIELLSGVSKEQANAAKNQAKASYIAATDALEALNGNKLEYSVGLVVDSTLGDQKERYAELFKGLAEIFSGDGFYFLNNNGMGGAWSNAIPESLEQLVSQYEKATKARDLFLETFNENEELPGSYDQLDGYLENNADIYEQAKAAIDGLNKATANAEFLDKFDLKKDYTDLKDINTVIDDIVNNSERGESLRPYLVSLAEEYFDVAKAAKEAGNALGGPMELIPQAVTGVDNTTAAVTTLTDAINAAAEAKAKFDAMMATSEEDGMNGYLNAVQTLEEELKAKKYNSWAAHASYRMLLGDEAYESAGGSAAQLYKMYTTLAEGQKMSAQEAVRMLNTKYYDNGVEVEGAGFVKMLEKLGYQVTDAMGNISLAADVFSDANIAKLSKETGLSEDFLWSFAQVLDQYDINGHATKSLEKTSGESDLNANSNAVISNTAAIESLTAALGASGLTAKKESGTWGTDAIAAGKGPLDPELPKEINETVQGAFQKAFEETAKETKKNILLDNPFIPKTPTAPALPERPEHSGSGGTFQREHSGSGGTFQLKGEVSEVDTSKVDGTPISVKPELDEEPEISAEEIKIPTTLDDAEAKSQKDELAQDGEVTIIANAETDAAQVALDALTQPRSVTITVNTVGISTGKGGSFAKGTQNHPGGLSLVNDGDGPELIVQDGRAFIAGGGKPALLSLEKGAKVFTAGETRQILGGGSVPAYASGTNSIIYGSTVESINTVLTPGTWTTDPNGNKGNGGSGGKGNTSSSDMSYSGGTSSGGGSSKSDDPWEKLVEMVDYILDRVSKALDQQLEAIDKQISALQEARDAAKAQNELEDRQEAVAKAQKDLEEAMNERTVRYLGDDGQWHWMADQGKVKSAQEALKDAQDSLQEYLNDQEYEKQVSDLEKEKDRLQEEFDKISDAWDEIQDAVNTPTGVLSEIISSVLASGTDQEKKGAGAVNGTLIGALMESIYGKNYQEALDAIAKATAGNPLMPGESDQKLSDLISKPSASADGLTSDVLSHLAPSGTTATQMAAGGSVSGYIGQQTNNYYSINGFSIGAQEAAQPLSVTMQRLSVYANGNYS